jgi:hypothetical protein
VTSLGGAARSTERAWRLEQRVVKVGSVRVPLRLVQFRTGWIASADTSVGPTLGADRSPYLAAARALEPLGVDVAEALVAVGRVPGAAILDAAHLGGVPPWSAAARAYAVALMKRAATRHIHADRAARVTGS